VRHGRWTTHADQLTPSPLPTLDAGVTVGDLGETVILDRIRRRVPPAPDWVSTGIGDDAAVFTPARGTLDVVTTDTLVEGIHFERSFVPAGDLGHKALAVNLSDLAAMGATPRVAVLSIVLPAAMVMSDLDALVRGMLDLADRHRVALVGGNITRSSGPLVLGMTAIGAVKRRRVLTRTGGRPGDELWVTGALGAATAGLACLLNTPDEPPKTNGDIAACVEWYRRPEPRVRIGTLTGRNRAARAAIDLSDGLGDGIHQLAAASGVGARLDGSAVPIHPGASQWFGLQGLDPLHATIVGGDDYELLLAVPRAYRRRFAAVSRQASGVPITCIGELTKDRAVVLRSEKGEQPVARGYEHFKNPAGKKGEAGET